MIWVDSYVRFRKLELLLHSMMFGLEYVSTFISTLSKFASVGKLLFSSLLSLQILKLLNLSLFFQELF